MSADKNNDDQVQVTPSTDVAMGPSPSTHPLLIPHVLRSILEYLPTDTVKKVRVVCTDWNHESCLLLQKRQPESKATTFSFDKNINSYLQVFGESPSSSSPSPQLHSTYQLHNMVKFTELTESWGNQSPAPTPLHRFLRAHGPHIQTLILQQQHPPVLEKELYWALENHLPVLESLTLRYVPIQPSTQPPALALLQKQVSFRRIKHLTFGTSSFREGLRRRFTGYPLPYLAKRPMLGHHPQPATLNWLGDDDSINAVLINLFGSVPNLVSLSISTLAYPGLSFAFGAPSHIEALRIKRITKGSKLIMDALSRVPLERLSKHLRAFNFPLYIYSRENLMTLRRLLTSAASSRSHHTNRCQLEHRISAPITLDFNLETDEKTVVEETVQFLRVLAKSSTYKRLKLSVSQHHIWKEFQQELMWSRSGALLRLLPSLHTLKICGKPLRGECGTLIDSRSLQKLAIIFPQLRVLQISDADDLALRTVYGGFPNLTEFGVTYGRFTDAGVTGVPLGICEAHICGGAPLQRDTADQLRSNLFIGNLLTLRHLHLHSDAMTSLSVPWGVSSCEGLEYLELRGVKVDNNTVQVIFSEMGDGGSGTSLRLLKYLDVRDCRAVTVDVHMILGTAPRRVQGQLYACLNDTVRPPLGCSLDWENLDEAGLDRWGRKFNDQNSDYAWGSGIPYYY